MIFLRDLVADPQVQLAANADKQLKEDCVVVESLGSGSVEHAHAWSKKRKFKDYVQELQDEYLPASCESVDSDEYLDCSYLNDSYLILYRVVDNIS